MTPEKQRSEYENETRRKPDEGKQEALVELEDGNPGGEVKVIRKEA